jgi:carboxypeptidase D
VTALHADAHPGAWIECRGRVHQEMHERLSDSAIKVLPKVLERIPVLLFAGDQDLICNYVGLEAMMQAMEWNGAKGLGVRVATSFVRVLLTGSYRRCRRSRGASPARPPAHGSPHGT